MSKGFRWLAAALLGLLCASAAGAGTYTVGVYYFPGWRPAQGSDDPWSKIKPYPEREPALGWYDDRDQHVVDQQIQWMSQFGINLVVFDWYWDGAKLAAANGQSIDAYRNSAYKKLLNFSVLWCETPKDLAQFDQIVSFFIQNYFTDPQIYRIDSKPVVFILSPEGIVGLAQHSNMTPKELLDRARAKAKSMGQAGIYFVASADPIQKRVDSFGINTAYDATSAYNYHRGYSGVFDNRSLAHSYSELGAGYAESWKWFLGNTTNPYFVPVTSGWDKKPWGGSQDPLHDNSVSTPASFEALLRQARDTLDKNPQKTLNTVMICCWNEFGEGSYVEPTKKFGEAYGQAIKNVFGGH
jgi:hypothetical protein